MKVLSGKYRHNTSNYWELGVRIMRRERRNGVIMSESYAVNEKRELILQKVKEFIVAHGGIVKKNQLEELHIDYRRILDFVEKGDLIRIKSGYYTIRSRGLVRRMN